jgi:hypothetical protein
MGWRIVLQPNGKLAKFSENVDDFICVNMTKEEAIALCSDVMSNDAAINKVQAGLDDIKALNTKIKGSGLNRWNECLEIISDRHGIKKSADYVEMCC